MMGCLVNHHSGDSFYAKPRSDGLWPNFVLVAQAKPRSSGLRARLRSGGAGL
jgi:hypothetical protein